MKKGRFYGCSQRINCLNSYVISSKNKMLSLTKDELMGKSKCDPKSELAKRIEEFIEFVSNNNIEIYNEFSLQHELGIFFRNKLPDFLVQFERNVNYFFEANVVDEAQFTKREMDIAVFTKVEDKFELKYAIELKFPRNGQYPEQMFSCCKDIAFLEELKKHGFAATALLIFAEDKLFYGRGSNDKDKIYEYFRTYQQKDVTPLEGDIYKPTGPDKDRLKVNIKGKYPVNWVDINDQRKYAFIESC
jgi:hypothetical protein